MTQDGRDRLEARTRRTSATAARRRRTSRVAALVAALVLVAVVAVVGFLGVRALLGSHRSASAQGAVKASTSAGPASKPAPAPSLATQTATVSASPGAKPAPVADPARDQAVPVLMYHHIMPNPNNSIAITPAAFDGQMSYLKDHGFHPITISQMNDFVLTGKRLPDKPVLITFDDGRMNQITYGVPILKKYGFTATFFVVKKWIVTTSPSFMHAAELKQLVADGFDVQSHTTNHIQIHPAKSASGVLETYAHFKARYWDPTHGMITYMTSDLGLPPVFALAYPGGRFNLQAQQIAGEAGYTLAFTTDTGYVSYQGQNPLALPRWNTGARGTTLATFAAVVNGAQHYKPKKTSK